MQSPTPKSVVGPLGERITLATLPDPATPRWVARRKAEVVAAVHGGLLSSEQACQHYNLTLEEFAGWQRSVERLGLKGLHITRTQLNRDRQTAGLRGKADRVPPPNKRTKARPVSKGEVPPPPKPHTFAHTKFDPGSLARLIAGDRHEFCIIDEVTPAGIEVTLFAPIPIGHALEIMMANGDRHHVHCQRSEGGRASLRFAELHPQEPQIVHAALAGRRRQSRLRVALGGMLHLGEIATEICFHDISRHGAAFRTDRWLLIGELVRIETHLLPSIYAKVRWRNHPHYGVCFEQSVSLDALEQSAT